MTTADESSALAEKSIALARRYEDTMGLTREGAIRRVEALHDALLDLAYSVTAERDRLLAERHDVAAAGAAEMERCAKVADTHTLPPAGGPFSHTNSMPVISIGIAKAIHKGNHEHD